MIKKSTIPYQNAFLVTFVTFCFLGLWAIIKENILLTIIFKIIRFSSLILFYIFSSKRINRLFILALLLFLISDFFYTFNTLHLLGIIFLGASRIPLIKILITDMKKSYNKTFTTVLVLFSGFLAFVAWLLYKNTLFYYTSIISSFCLVVIFSLSFALLIEENTKRNVLMFSGIALFLFSDAVFGAQKIHHINIVYIVSAYVIYNIAYYLIVKSIIKKDTIFLLKK